MTRVEARESGGAVFQLILIAGVILYESHMWHIMDVTTHTVEVST